jgi:hypothetical protein
VATHDAYGAEAWVRLESEPAAIHHPGSMTTLGRFLFTRRGTEDLRRGFLGFRNDLIRLSGILALIGVLCAPGIISKLVGLLKLGIAGASPAISVGTVVVQTAPLTLALCVVLLFIPNYVAADEGSALGRLRAVTSGRFVPIGIKIFLPLTFCALVLGRDRRFAGRSANE